MGLINRKAVKDTILEEAIKHDARTTKTWSRVTEASIDRVERETLAVIRRLVKPDRLPKVGKTVNLT